MRKGARLTLDEVSGSLGDLGTFLPLLVGMASQNGLDFATALFFAGVFNLATGFLFAIPMAVQPMKAIAAVAITEGLSLPQILAAGILVGAVILLLGVTGLIDQVDRLCPRSVVRGIQLAVGLSLLIKGLKLIAGTGAWLAVDGYLLAIAATLFSLFAFQSRRIPGALVVFAVGIVLAVVKDPQAAGLVHLGFSLPHWGPPAWSDFVPAFWKAALPQIPLTTLNSVIAVCALSRDLFPDRPARPRTVAVSVGLMNLIGAPFGAMPMCHGAGGLAGQYRFGARTNGSILFLGAAKLTAAVLFGSSLMALCKVFPASLLGVLLGFSGIELALVTRDMNRRSDAFAMLVTAGVSLGLDNIGIGFLAGLALAWLARLQESPPPSP